MTVHAIIAARRRNLDRIYSGKCVCRMANQMGLTGSLDFPCTRRCTRIMKWHYRKFNRNGLLKKGY